MNINTFMKGRMLYVGWLGGWVTKHFKEKLMKTWLAYDHEYNRAFLFSKSERTKVFWVTTRSMDDELIPEIQHKAFDLTLKQLHEKFYYPIFLDGKALKRKAEEINTGRR